MTNKNKYEMEHEFKVTKEDVCYDCQRQHLDSCADCCDGNLYMSPDDYETSIIAELEGAE